MDILSATLFIIFYIAASIVVAVLGAKVGNALGNATPAPRAPMLFDDELKEVEND